MATITEGDFKRFSILFAEDDETVLNNIGYVLRSYFQEAYTAKDGEEAWELYLSHHPDIILTDIRMPKLDGIALVKKIRQQDEDTPIIMLTAHSDEHYLLEAVKLYLEDYLIKPISHAKLITTLAQCIQKIPHYAPSEIELGEGISYSFISKELTAPQGTTPLTHLEISFLELLITHRGRVVGYDEIEEKVWKEEVMTKDAIKTLVKKLRNKLPHHSISNIVGIGYKLEC